MASKQAEAVFEQMISWLCPNCERGHCGICYDSFTQRSYHPDYEAMRATLAILSAGRRCRCECNGQRKAVAGAIATLWENGKPRR